MLDFGWDHVDAVKLEVLVITITNICVLMVGAMYSVGMLAERPAGLGVWQILCALLSTLSIYMLYMYSTYDCNEVRGGWHALPERS